MTIRRQIRVRGAVQGVGFRPNVYRIAAENELTGWVLNDVDGVLLEVEGSEENVADFERRLVEEAPVHARIEAVEPTDVPTTGAEAFEILASPAGADGLAAILPDLATCPECLAEVLDPDDRRYRYPFTNCTNCGPRFSIIDRLPYDRHNTTMAGFTMCEACQSEYDDPTDRRFHAQPNACRECGPQLMLDDARGEQALLEAVGAIRAGGVVAVKGLGGFHLLVDATNSSAIARLRQRKRRSTKPFAVMFADQGQLLEHCDPSGVELAEVSSPASPIVIMRRGQALPDTVAPGNPNVGALLPYTPLHHLLLHEVGRPLVATSANMTGEPICTDIGTARRLLGDVADAFLDHDRPIGRPVEDSVVRQYADGIVVLRRGRGFAPAPVGELAAPPERSVLGRGAQLKAALAVSRGSQVVAGPHIGDLSNDLRVIETYERAVEDVGALLAPSVGIEAHDLHPDYISRRGLRGSTVAVQHHHAHAAACLLEHQLDRVLAVVWDGTGYGPDGTVWGGEFLDATLDGFERFAHLRQFSLPGGERAVREPLRSAFALGWELGRELGMPLMEEEFLGPMIDQGINAPRTSSAGRLFDGVSFLLGFAPEVISFDGEAAIALEHAAGDRVGASLPVPELVDGMLDWGPLVEALLDSDADRHALAAGFHDVLARAIALVAEQADIEHVALVGGCFQNRRLLETAAREVEAVGLTPVWCRQIPPNDGGIAAGQVAVAAARQWKK